MKTPPQPALKVSRPDSGMTLIDLAVFMTVIGLLALPLINSYNNWKNGKAKADTGGAMASIDQAIASFYFENNGRYPCPANPALDINAPGAGVEDCSPPVGPGVLEGAVPFATLRIPPSASLDGWSNKITYAVTNPHRVAVAGANGAIRVRGYSSKTIPGNPEPVCDRDSGVLDTNLNVHYLLIAHGPNGAGAFPAHGDGVNPIARRACLGVGQEVENCNANDGIYFKDYCAHSGRTGSAEYFDDVVSENIRTEAPSRLWVYANDDQRDIVTTVPKVGINNPTPQVALDVRGNIRAKDVRAEWMCDVNGANCFHPKNIGGADPLMNCATQADAMGMSGIVGAAVGVAVGPTTKSAKAKCSINLKPSAASSCGGSTPYAIGFNADGTVKCGS